MCLCSRILKAKVSENRINSIWLLVFMKAVFNTMIGKKIAKMWSWKYANFSTLAYEIHLLTAKTYYRLSLIEIILSHRRNIQVEGVLISFNKHNLLGFWQKNALGLSERVKWWQKNFEIIFHFFHDLLRVINGFCFMTDFSSCGEVVISTRDVIEAWECQWEK